MDKEKKLNHLLITIIELQNQITHYSDEFNDDNINHKSPLLNRLLEDVVMIQETLMAIKLEQTEGTENQLEEIKLAIEQIFSDYDEILNAHGSVTQAQQKDILSTSIVTDKIDGMVILISALEAELKLLHPEVENELQQINKNIDRILDTIEKSSYDKIIIEDILVVEAYKDADRLFNTLDKLYNNLKNLKCKINN